MSSTAADTNITADAALQRLLAGNERFANGKAVLGRDYIGKLSRLVDGQSPIATVLGCSDSRVPPELIFDAGLGDLFVVRVAGNVFSPEVAGSLQYAGSHLKTPLFMVLGHEGCGAVWAALQSKTANEVHSSRIQLLVESILPGLKDLDTALEESAQLASAVDANVRWTVDQILNTPEGRQRQKEGVLKIVGAVYEIRTGRVRLL
jgi:carbonic anhydrase